MSRNTVRTARFLRINCINPTEKKDEAEKRDQ